MTFGKILADHRSHFQATHKSAPTEFAALWDWAEKDMHRAQQQRSKVNRYKSRMNCGAT